MDLKQTLAKVDQLAPRISALGAVAEDERRLPETLVREMLDAGLFQILQPAAFGGLELDMRDALRVLEAVTALDGAVGWSLLKGATTNQMASYLPERGAREVWADPRIATAGSFNPKGRAVAVEGGYRLTGRWDWGTGVNHSAWIVAGAMITTADGELLRGENGAPVVKALFFPRDAATLYLDTWRAHGMRGTGSMEYSVSDLFVPDYRTFAGVMAEPVTHNRVTTVPLHLQLPLPHAAIAIGLAEGAFNAFLDLALVKTPLFSSSRLAEDRLTHDQVGRARAEIDSARAYVRVATDRAWPQDGQASAGAGDLGLVAAQATRLCVSAVDRLYTLAGGSAVFESNRIQRAWRDIHVAASHFLVNNDKFAANGKQALERWAPKGSA